MNRIEGINYAFGMPLNSLMFLFPACSAVKIFDGLFSSFFLEDRPSLRVSASISQSIVELATIGFLKIDVRDFIIGLSRYGLRGEENASVFSDFLVQMSSPVAMCAQS